MVMGLADFALDIKSVVAAYQFDSSIGEGVSDLTLAMLIAVAVPHVLRAVMSAREAWEKAEERAKRLAGGGAAVRAARVVWKPMQEGKPTRVTARNAPRMPESGTTRNATESWAPSSSDTRGALVCSVNTVTGQVVRA